MQSIKNMEQVPLCGSNDKRRNLAKQISSRKCIHLPVACPNSYTTRINQHVKFMMDSGVRRTYNGIQTEKCFVEEEAHAERQEKCVCFMFEFNGNFAKKHSISSSIVQFECVLLKNFSSNVVYFNLVVLVNLI